MKISKYLTLEEAIKSPTALRLGISNMPDEDQLINMEYVANEIFDRVREVVGGPLYVSSFFRSKELNDAVPGSSATSQHMKGQAIDIDCDVFGNGTNKDVFDFIRLTLEFDQVINEYPDKLGNPSWVHVSKTMGNNRGQVLVKLKNKYIPYSAYTVGMI